MYSKKNKLWYLSLNVKSTNFYYLKLDFEYKISVIRSEASYMKETSGAMLNIAGLDP